MPIDTKVTKVANRYALTYDALDPHNTAEGFVHSTFVEYGHSFNGIDIAAGGRGDRIRAQIRANKVIGLNRHWREIVGATGPSQQVISAGDALGVAVENIPKVILFPRDKGYSITKIKLFYYGLPSEEEGQYLTPAWGFRVGEFLWVYVNAFTGEFLL